VYWSRWITASTGSVLSLWGDAGDPVVELRHLKPPRSEVGPFMVEIDHAAGSMAIVEGTDLLGLLRAAPNGLSAKDAGRSMEGANERARVQKARRKLDDLVERKLAYRQPGEVIRGAVTEPDRYYATPREGSG
jgi:replicative DNA helicase